MARERVEFVDAPEPAPGPSAPGADDLHVGPAGDPPRGLPRRRRLALGAAAVAVVTAAAVTGVGRGAAPHGAVAAAPPAAGAAYGVVTLPPPIGRPWQLVAAAAGDVVWLLDRGTGIARIAAGRVTATTVLDRPVTAAAVSPDGRTLYVATAGARPGLQALDARTLAVGRSVPLDVTVQSLAVSGSDVWAAASGVVLRRGPGDLADRGVLPLPGVVTVERLAVDLATATPTLSALVTTAAAGTRLLGLDPTTGAVSLGPVLPGAVTVADGHLLTWVSWTPPDAAAGATADRTVVRTVGYVRPGDADPEAVSWSVPAGSRIYDGGPGFAAFYAVSPGGRAVVCHDTGGFRLAYVDLDAVAPGAVVTGQVLRTDAALYAVTDRGLVRTGVGACR